MRWSGSAGSPFPRLGGPFCRQRSAEVACLIILFLANEGRAELSFAPAVSFPVGDYALFVAAADLDGDSASDVVAAVPSELVVLRGTGDGGFHLAVSYPVGAFVTNVAIADVNGDGILDLINTTTTAGPSPVGSVNVLLGNGDGSFQAPVQFAAVDFPGCTRSTKSCFL